MFKRLGKYFEGRRRKKAGKRRAEVGDYAARLAEAQKIDDPAERLLALKRVKDAIGKAKEKRDAAADASKKDLSMGLIASYPAVLTTALAFGACIAYGPGAIEWKGAGVLAGVDAVTLTLAGALKTRVRKRQEDADAFGNDIAATEGRLDGSEKKTLQNKAEIVNSVFFLDVLEARPELKDAFLQSMQKTSAPPAAKRQKPLRPKNAPRP